MKCIVCQIITEPFEAIDIKKFRGGITNGRYDKSNHKKEYQKVQI